MRTYKTLFGTLAVSFLFELALTDFSVWEVLNFDGYSRGYNVWDDSIPTCFEAASRAQSFDLVDDASGRNVGVRCEGKLGCGKEGSPSDIDIFEMNLHWMNPTLHWTCALYQLNKQDPAIYKNVGYPLVGLDNSFWGTCVPQDLDFQHSFLCDWGEGQRLFRCVGDQPGRTLPSAKDINHLYKYPI